MRKEMTLFQARFVQWLTLKGCSLRATASYYRDRYDQGLPFGSKVVGPFTVGGNQVDGILLRTEAIDLLKEKGIDPVIGVYDNNIGYEEDSYEKWKQNLNNGIKRKI